jgi:hypothetical protein
MEVIRHFEAGAGGVSTVLMNNIPGTFTDLYLIVSLRHNASGGNGAFIKLNGISAAYTTLYGQGSSTIGHTTTDVSGLAQPNSYTANVFNVGTLYIPSYTSTTLRKAITADAANENDATQAILGISAAYVDTTDPVTSIEIIPNSSPLVAAPQLQYSTFTLYGITAGTDGVTTTTVS